MSIFVIGINHKTASIEVREKVYFSMDKLSLYLRDLLNHGLAYEAVLLSTCNRSELYCHTDNLQAAKDWFHKQTSLSIDVLNEALYVYEGTKAVQHIMEVACGLDSMVLGEPQILGQMKEAFSESCTADAIGSTFHRLFQQVFTLAKDIRTTTAIGACPVSVASAAVNFVKQHLNDFSQANVVLIGAGDTTELLLRYLHSQLSTPLTVVNRTLEKAHALTNEWGGRVVGLDKLAEALMNADVVFSATASAVPLVTKELIKKVMFTRVNKPLLFVDIAVPRDIDPCVSEVENVKLYSIDDLMTLIEKNRQGREHAAEKARELIRAKSDSFNNELISLDKISHVIRSYRGQIEEICRMELMKSKQQLHRGSDPMLVLDAFAHAFIKKLLHAPSVQLRQAGVEGRLELLHLAKKLFSLPDQDAERL